jgi:competence ComEA-like helix-hairpin-helix protein
MQKIKSAIWLLFITAVLLCGSVCPSYSADLQKFSNAKLINNSANDGDSFLLEANGKTIHLRLYLVDCPETYISFTSDAQRVREQTRYFGLSDAKRTVHFGNEAKVFTERTLSKPFTVHTAFVSALGRSSKGRVYGFVTTSDGNDLASMLVKNGLARTHGISKQTPDGVSGAEMIERLRVFEISAMLKRIGIWAESDPDRISELRAKQRSEDQELKELKSQVSKSEFPQSILDLNSASKKELQSIKGIGSVYADRIIAGRPYSTVDDLLKVKGIGQKKLDTIRSFVVVEKK